MQIHELTQNPVKKPMNEGLLDRAREYISPTMTDKGTTTAQEEKIHQLATKAQSAWNGFVQKYSASLDDPQEKTDYLSNADGLMEQQFTEFVERNLLGKQPINRFANANKIKSLVDQIVGSESPNALHPAPQPQPSTVSKPTSAAPTAAPQPVAPAAEPQVAVHVSPRGTTISAGEPHTLTYKGKEYVVDDDGDWANLSTGRKVRLEALAKFLDSEEDWFAHNGMINEAMDPASQHKLFMDLIRQTSLATPARKGTAQPRQRSYEPDNEKIVYSTGNSQADALLKAAGFEVK